MFLYNRFVKKSSIISPILLSVFLSSCTTTSYQKLDSSVGYWDESIDQSADTFKIGFDGAEWNKNSIAEQEKVIDYALLRSAEVALDNGFRYFVISENLSYTEKKTTKETETSNSETFRHKAIFTTVNYVDLEEKLRHNSMMQDGEFKGYAVYNVDLVLYTIKIKYNLSNYKLLRNFETGMQGRRIPGTSRGMIETIDAVPHNPISLPDQ
jgi:hypothetical protein